ncbi:helix-turn-helix transcriptional regulator [Marinibaculum pumilum]|uniref:Helix-turn-helix transcriptional regulator n=1 Tax=Marinibaculum pumilum TaxID=1766165 RepID=A0ABV7L1Q5_9PROT
MRQDQALQVLRLALALRGTTMGLTLADMQQLLGVTERTAHRLRNAVAELFPALEMHVGDDQRKYWRLPPGHAERLVNFSAEELAGLESSRQVLAAAGHDDAAGRLGLLAEKIRAILPPAQGRRLEPDVEALLEAESFAIRPGPRPHRRPEVMAGLRQAIMAGCCVAIRYRYRGRRGHNEARVTDVVLQPYGILLGSRHYLIAHKPPAAGDDGAGGSGAGAAADGPYLRMYALPEVERVTVLADRPFARRADISLQDFAQRAFGIFQEEPRQVVWRFSGPAVRDASQFLFHPRQEVEALPDGRLEVRFTAGGLREMAWHLFTWGRHVEVVAPAELRALYATALAEGGAPPVPDLDDRQADLFD